MPRHGGLKGGGCESGGVAGGRNGGSGMNYTQIVNKFGKIMIKKLQENYHKSGWKNEDDRFLLGSAFGELHELSQAILAYH